MSISNNNNSPIGFFDSGVGGLTVLEKVKKILPKESFLFFGDTLHVPYGNKTKNQLLSYAKPILEFFESKNCKAVVMACNTTSSVIYEDIKGKYNFELYPVVQSVAKMLGDFNIDRLGVFATKATIESHAYQNEIAKYNNEMKVYGQYCPEWVNIVENNLTDDKKSQDIVKSDLEKMLKNNPQKIVLGCTHYPYLLNVLSKWVHKDMFIDPSKYLADFIKLDLDKKKLLSYNDERFEEFYVSSNPEKFKLASGMFYKLNEPPKLLTFFD